MEQFFKELFLTYGGLGIVFTVAAFAVIWFIRHTQTKKDDEVLDKFVVTSIEYALKVMPQDSAISWVKFTANAMAKFVEVYTKTQGQPANAKIYDKAKLLIEAIASQKEIESLPKALQKN